MRSFERTLQNHQCFLCADSQATSASDAMTVGPLRKIRYQKRAGFSGAESMNGVWPVINSATTRPLGGAEVIP